MSAQGSRTAHAFLNVRRRESTIGSGVSIDWQILYNRYGIQYTKLKKDKTDENRAKTDSELL